MQGSVVRLIMVEASSPPKNCPEVEVRIYHAKLDPERVSEMVGVRPTFSTRAGEERPGQTTGRAIRGRTGTWLWRTTGASRDEPLVLLDAAVKRVERGLLSVKAAWPDARVVFAFHLVKPDPSKLVRASARIGNLGEMEASAGADYAPMVPPPPSLHEARRFG